MVLLLYMECNFHFSSLSRVGYRLASPIQESLIKLVLTDNFDHYASNAKQNNDKTEGFF